ncbi:hypothetical protein L6452_08970 [Arctium lappa]|uniref:Uncharacterized protein n=1 Tax=Arctium lappa TaxID=4217 RepID=A0ACB9DJ72_ARCLA|nr:hypothetical protein L6452_08970 [Arctium lappa]
MESPPSSKLISNGSYSPGGGSSVGDGGLGYIGHTVTKFDTLAGVAIKYDVEVADIKRMNGLTTDLHMFARKTLQIPLPGSQISIWSALFDTQFHLSILTMRSSLLLRLEEIAELCALLLPPLVDLNTDLGFMSHEQDDDGVDMKIEDTNHADIEELEKEYNDLRHEEQKGMPVTYPTSAQASMHEETVVAPTSGSERQTQPSRLIWSLLTDTFLTLMLRIL